ncbi:hypothetical protein R3P38DRAFT_3115761 [Favolaschia claudopus]|uniref:BZIP domain-containing protein n=1 Tax=Favolaschia claudopus TaxID=2862362 RepID=A0AAV9ZFS4_9AGAR
MNYHTQVASWAPSPSTHSSPMGTASWQTSPMLSSTASDEYDRDDFDQPQLTSDSRRRPPNTTSDAAISVPSHNTYTTQRDDVHSLNISGSFRPPSPAPRFNGLSATPFESFPNSDNVPINHSPSLRTPAVFPSPSELAAHYGLPRNFPPPPRPVTHHRQNSPPKQPSTQFADTDLCSGYLQMLSQQPSEHVAHSAEATTAVPNDLVGTANTMNMMQDLDLEASPEYRGFGDDFDPTLPAFSDNANDIEMSPYFEELSSYGGPSFASASYLTSPFETPGQDYATSPCEDSPLSELLGTPVMPDTSDDGVGIYQHLNLFGGIQEVPITNEVVTIAPKLPLSGKLFTISPSTPALDFIDPVTTVFSGPKSQSTTPASPALEAPRARPTRRRAAVTGTRKNLKPESLTPLDAPTQKRTYVLPSATSRKAVPATFQKKRKHSTAFPDGDEEPPSPTLSEQEMIDHKRRLNTLAARASRRRKLQNQQETEAQVASLTAEVALWKKRAEKGVELLRENRIRFDGWKD